MKDEFSNLINSLYKHSLKVTTFDILIFVYIIIYQIIEITAYEYIY